MLHRGVRARRFLFLAVMGVESEEEFYNVIFPPLKICTGARITL